MHGISKGSFSDMNPVNAPIICVVFFCLDRAITGSILQNDKRNLKTRRRSRQFPEAKKQYFEYGLVWVNNGFNAV